MNEIKANLKAVIGSSKYGVPIQELECEYQNITRSVLNYQYFNFLDLKSFLISMNDIVTLKQFKSQTMVCLVTSDFDPPCLKQLRNFIQYSQSPNNKQQKNNGNSNSFHASSNHFNQMSSNIKELMTSDSNSHCNFKVTFSNPYHRNIASFVNAQYNNNYHVANSTLLLPTNIYRNHFMPNKFNTLEAKPGPQFINPNNGTYNQKNCDMESFHTYFDQLSISKSNNQIYLVDRDSSDLWLLNCNTSVDVLHKQLKIFGVQSGFAVVRLLDFIQNSVYIKTQAATSYFPGDFVLWQPPYSDPNRPNSFIDTSLVFPVTIIDQFTDDIVQVRVDGSRILIIVRMIDLFEFPRNKTFVEKLQSEMKDRKLTLIRLTGIPDFMDFWDKDFLKNAYFPPVCTDENQYIVERCGQRGDFLNIKLLNYFNTHCISKLPIETKQRFYDNLLIAINYCKKSLLTKFKEAYLEETEEFEDSVFKIIHEVPIKESSMLIGCPKLFIESLTSNRKSLRDDELLFLERVVFDPSKQRICYFDRDFEEAIWSASKDKFPGLFQINEMFIKSRLSRMCEMRFQAAMLVHMPSVSQMKFNLL